MQYQFSVYKINAELIKSTHVLLKVETKLLLFLLIKVMDVKLVQESNAELPIFVTPLGRLVIPSPASYL